MIKIFCSRRAGTIIFVVALISVIFFALILGKGVNAQTSSQCTDSDGGNDHYVKGVLSGTAGQYVYTDACGSGTNKIPKANHLQEWDCSGKHVTLENFNCPNGCKDGACVQKEFSYANCSDTDGGTDYFVKGDFTYDTLRNGKVNGHAGGTEKCVGNIVEENSCTDGSPKITRYTCPKGCKDGACIEEPKVECTDSDNGQNFSVKGTTVGKLAGEQGSYVDSCKDDGMLAEYYCEDSPTPHVVLQDNDCPNGCSDGVCVEEPSEEDLEQIENQKKIQELITGAKGMTGMLNAINVMQRAFMQLAQQGVVMPEELAQTIARVKELGPAMNDFKNRKAENVTDEEAETLTDNVSELCEIGPTLEEWGDKVPQFLQIGAKMKQLSKDLKKAKSDVKLAVKAAARSKFGISDKVDELNGAFEALKVTSDDAIASTDFDEKDGKINEFYDQFQDIYDTIGVINALQNTAKAKTEWGRRLKTNTNTISQLSKNAELDVSELVAKNDEIKTKVDELSPALAKKPIDRDEVKWIFEDLKARQSEFIDIADQLSGVKSALPKVQAVKFDTSQFKNFSAFSQFCGVSNENGEF